LNEAAHAKPIAPDLLALVLQIDLSDSSYQALARFAGTIASLFGTSRVQSDPHAVGLLDDLLGAVYSLILARHQRFVDRTDRPIEIAVVERRALQVHRGDVRIDGKWIAGWHFNSALFRIAAVYHRLLKLTSGQPATRIEITTRRPHVKSPAPLSSSLIRINARSWSRRLERSGRHLWRLKRRCQGLKHDSPRRGRLSMPRWADTTKSKDGWEASRRSFKPSGDRPAVRELEEGMRIPNTDSIQELAEFWDTHSVTDFDDQVEEVSEPLFARQLAHAVRVPLTAQERLALRRIAASRGVEEAALIREWVKEKLHSS
jgi:hypothetical protein